MVLDLAESVDAAWTAETVWIAWTAVGPEQRGVVVVAAWSAVQQEGPARGSGESVGACWTVEHHEGVAVDAERTAACR